MKCYKKRDKKIYKPVISYQKNPSAWYCKKYCEDIIPFVKSPIRNSLKQTKDPKLNLLFLQKTMFHIHTCIHKIYFQLKQQTTRNHPKPPETIQNYLKPPKISYNQPQNTRNSQQPFTKCIWLLLSSKILELYSTHFPKLLKNNEYSYFHFYCYCRYYYYYHYRNIRK